MTYGQKPKKLTKIERLPKKRFLVLAENMTDRAIVMSYFLLSKKGLTFST
ncbi:hypothetical protein GCM10025777_55240 [Membranihabitans marinus]